MKEKENLAVGDEARYTTRVTLRLTPEEYEKIRLFADKKGCTLSQAARLIIFDNSEGPASKSGKKKEQNNEISALARRVREDFKRIAAGYTSAVETYKRSLSLLNRDGSPSVNTQQTIRAVRGLQDMTIDLQKSVNSFLSGTGVKETHAAARIALPEVEEVARKVMTNKEYIMYCYMETMELIGLLEKDASVYTRKKDEGENAKERMAFSVSCLRNRKSRNIKIIYTVFADKTGVFEYLKAGEQVYVRGRFEENDKGDKIIFADTVKLLGKKEQEEEA
jgi:hypothetical protein